MKAFQEVFPSLQIKEDIRDLFGQVQVERISAPKDRSILRVYLCSGHLIEKDDIWYLEKEIKNQLFPHARMEVRIYEKFHLSAQYTPETLMDVYGQSLLKELKSYSPLEYSLLKRARLSYPDGHTVKMQMEDSLLAREKNAEVVRILEKVLNERCGFGVHVVTEYKEKEEKEETEEDVRSWEVERFS